MFYENKIITITVEARKDKNSGSQINKYLKKLNYITHG